MGGFCPGGFCPGGFCPGGILSGGILSGRICPKTEQPSFTLIALFLLEIGRCRGRNWLNGNQALILSAFCFVRSLLGGFFVKVKSCRPVSDSCGDYMRNISPG